MNDLASLCNQDKNYSRPLVEDCDSYFVALHAGVDTSTWYYYDKSNLTLVAVVARTAIQTFGPWCYAGPQGATAFTFTTNCSSTSPEMSCL